MKNLIEVNATLPILDIDFVAAELRLQKELIKYDVVVTVDTVKDARKLCAGLNKLSDSIDTTRKQKVEEVSAPVKLFDDQMKALVVLCKSGREKLTTQIEVFVRETIELTRPLMEAELISQYKAGSVAKMYQTGNLEPLLKLNALTKAGKLTKQSKGEIAALVASDLIIQNRVKIRELELISRCQAAGIPTMTKVQLKDVILLDDAVYEARVLELVGAEITRQAEIEETKDEVVGLEELSPIDPVMVQTEDGPTEVELSEPVELDYGGDPNQLADDSEVEIIDNVTWNIIANFQITIPSKITREQVKKQYIELFEKMKMKSLKNIGVSRE